MPKKNTTRKRVHWPNNTNKPLETREFINMSPNAVYARKSVKPSKTRYIENDSDNNVSMNSSINNPIIIKNNTTKISNNLWKNRNIMHINNRHTNNRHAHNRTSKRPRPNNWNNANTEGINYNEEMSNASNNDYYDPEENAEIARKMAALKRNINRNKRR